MGAESGGDVWAAGAGTEDVAAGTPAPCLQAAIVNNTAISMKRQKLIHKLQWQTGNLLCAQSKKFMRRTSCGAW
jgi:hypothetical protein